MGLDLAQGPPLSRSTHDMAKKRTIEIPDHLRIAALRAENVKRLDAVAIKPDGNAVTITGANGAGKSSVLDSIAYALGGKRLVPSEPIKRGRRKAAIEVELQNGEKTWATVIRTFTHGGSSLEIRGSEGQKFPSPQTLLDAVVGALSFNPLDFLDESAQAQATILLDLAGLGDALQELEDKRAGVYSDRTDVNRRARDLEATLRNWKEIPDDVPDVETSAADLVAELEAAQESNALKEGQRQEAAAAGQAIDAVKSRKTDTEDQVAQLRHDIAELKKELATTTTQLEADRVAILAAAEKATKLAAAADKLKNLDLGPIRNRIAAADQTNEWVRSRIARDKAQGELDRLNRQADVQTVTIGGFLDQKKKLLAGATFPVEGLAADFDGATYQGIPLDQASQAEKIRVSAEVGFALNPRLRVLLVREASLLDEDMLKALKASAVKHDGQIWLERVYAGKDEAAITIEDGNIVQAPDASERDDELDAEETSE